MPNAIDKTEAVNNVEQALYNRMLRNAFSGFLKSALIAGAIGAVLGAALFGGGILPPVLISGGIMETCAGSLALAGAFMGATAFMLPAGAFGAAAGINSARDARRYLLSDDPLNQRALIPEELNAAKTAAYSLAAQKEYRADWCKKLEASSHHTPQRC